MNIKNGHSSVFAKAKDRPYTYISKRNDKTKNLRTNCRFKVYQTGNKKLQKDYYGKISLYVTEDLQIFEKLLETTRLLLLTKMNKTTKKKLSRNEFFFKYYKYTHQVLRLKTVVSAQKGISVDRISKGMKLAFGKPEGLAVRTRHVKIPEAFIELFLSKKYYDKYLRQFKEDLKKVALKTPLRKKLVVVELSDQELSRNMTPEELQELKKSNFFDRSYRLSLKLDKNLLNKKSNSVLLAKGLALKYPLC